MNQKGEVGGDKCELIPPPYFLEDVSAPFSLFPNVSKPPPPPPLLKKKKKIREEEEEGEGKNEVQHPCSPQLPPLPIPSLLLLLQLVAHMRGGAP